MNNADGHGTIKPSIKPRLSAHLSDVGPFTKKHPADICQQGVQYSISSDQSPLPADRLHAVRWIVTAEFFRDEILSEVHTGE